MDIKKLKQLIKLAKEEKVVKLKFEDEHFKYAVTLAQEQAVGSWPSVPERPQRISKEVPASASKVLEGSHLFEVKSPFVGTFYRSPTPGDPPFVNVGDKVGPGQPLCILEAMKIMNEIDAEVSGEVIEICVEDESLVEYDQVLFKIRK